ncbi:hypothetical protein ISN75_06825 [Dyella marensis]|uniref:hypothetical protein n=1 Tax=Dyella marensis TaxID=500610 RepID=UPI0031D4D99D
MNIDTDQLNTQQVEHQDATPPADEPKSLREELSSSLAEIKERARDDQGRFSKDQKPVVDKVAKDPAAKVDVTAPEEVPFPASWRQDMKDKWGNLPPEVRKYVSEREAEVHKGFTKLDDERAFGKSMRETIQPYMALIQSEGAKPEEAVRSLLNTAYILRSGQPHQKVQAMRGVMDAYGIDPRELFATYQGAQQAPDPHVQSLESQLLELKQWRENLVAQQSNQVQDDANRQVADFASSAEHPHFERVRPRMAMLIQSGMASTMDEAYQQAVWADAELRSTMLEERQKAAEQAKRAEADARAKAARAAGGSVRGSPAIGSTATGDANLSLRDELKAQFAEARGQ